VTQVFNQCPKCQIDLPDGATGCACGWRKRGSKPDRPARESVPCAHQDCPREAILSKRLAAGWANLCRGHYEHHVQLEADEFCRASGLTTRPKQYAYAKDKLAGFGLRLPLTRGAAREPGQDDEERVA